MLSAPALPLSPRRGKIDPVQGTLERFYARLGLDAYLRFYYWINGVTALVLAAIAVVAFQRYRALTATDFAVTLAFVELCIGVVVWQGMRGAGRTMAATRRWMEAGRPPELAAEAWRDAALFPTRFVLPHFALAVCVAVVPVGIFGATYLELNAAETAGVLITSVVAGAYPTVLFAFQFEIWLRPVLREMAAQLSPDEVPRRAMIPLRARLYIAMPIIAVTAAFFVGVLRAPAELDRIALEALLAVAVGVVATILPLLFTTEAVLGPVSDLIDGTKRVREGDYTTPVPVLFTDELGVLAGAFNDMTDTLQRSREQAVRAREEERRRLSHDLHDGLGPTLAAFALRLQRAARRVEDETVRADLEALRDEVRATVGEVRRLVYDLRPPALDDVGLVEAIEQAAAAYGRGEGAPVILVQAEEGLPRFAAAVEVAALRIAQEALGNVVRHAGARQCEVQLRVNGGFELEVSDDGRGIEPRVMGGGVGIASMRSRAEELGGTLALHSAPGSGTVVRACFPVEDEE